MKKFAIPNAKVGSVIEYKYTLNSPFLSNLPTWYFQSPIPVIWSECRTEIPEYFDYKRVFGGYISSAISEETNTLRSIIFISGGTNIDQNGRPTPVSHSDNSVKYTATINRWVFKDVPAFRNEKFITTASDYYAKVEFELLSVSFPRSATKTYTSTWDEIGRGLMETDRFGTAIDRKSITKKLADPIIAANVPDAQKVSMAYKSLKKHIKWNGEYGYYIENTLRSAFNEQIGNVAEVNLALVNLLKGVGLVSYPVLLSTRRHGRLNTYYPRRSDFNYVIAAAVIEGKIILLDAIADFLLPGQLPFRCMNDKGLIVKDNSTMWVDLRTNEQSYTNNMAMISLTSDGTLSGMLMNKYRGENARMLRHKINRDGKEKYIENTKKEQDDWEIEEIHINNELDPSKTLAEKIQISEFNNIDTEAEIIYLPVVINNQITENPFESETRKYPVNFGIPKLQKIMVNYKIPDNYKAEELPENALITLPNKAAVFSFRAQVTGGSLQILSQLKINKPIFTAEEYKLLREFYTHVIEKLNEQVVLKRI